PSSLAATPTTSTAPNGRKRKRKGADPAAAPIIEADSGTATATDLENTSAGFAPSAAPAAASESGRSRSGRHRVQGSCIHQRQRRMSSWLRAVECARGVGVRE
ncbi:unnamed protein product, partial [Pylaiella littoralis]